MSWGKTRSEQDRLRSEKQRACPSSISSSLSAVRLLLRDRLLVHSGYGKFIVRRWIGAARIAPRTFTRTVGTVLNSQTTLEATITSPVGQLIVRVRDEHIEELRWSQAARNDTHPLISETIKQIAAYFDGSLKTFELPLRPHGESFQRAVCDAMLAIPYGETRTYGEIAASIGSAAQPVGQACGGNSIPIIIPCHRVLAANGLGGYSGQGGLDTKIALLKHEDAFPYLL